MIGKPPASVAPSIHSSTNPAIQDKTMSKTSESANAKTKSAAKRAEVGPAMFGRDIFVEALEREDVEVIFAYPGGASMEIHQSLTHSKILSLIHISEPTRQAEISYAVFCLK